MAARQLVALWDGLQVQWLLDPEQSMSPVMEDFLATLEVSPPS